MRKNLFFFLLSLVFTTTAWAEGYDVVNTGEKTRTDRNVTTLKLNSIYASYAGNTVNLTAEQYGMAYADLTESATMKAAAGETVTLDVTYRGSWMHGYLYIDANGDGTFTAGLADDGFTPTGDLVSYSNASPDESTWFNSKGASDSNSTHVLPSFVTPTKAGKYRARYMLDWNSIDPKGVTPGFMDNGGVIIDFMLEITGSYNFSVGKQVTSLADIKAEQAYLLKYDAMPEVFNNTTGPGSDLYIAMTSNENTGYEKAADVTVKSLTQFIPTENENEYIIYQPIMGTYLGDAGRWSGGYLPDNYHGWQRFYNEVRVAQPVKLTDAGNGEFYISYLLDEYYDANGIKGEANVDVYVGLVQHAQYRCFAKTLFEQMDGFSLDGSDFENKGYGLPVDFRVKIVEADGVKEVLEVKTQADIEREVLETLVKQVTPLNDAKYQFVFTNNADEAARIDLTKFPAALEAAQALVDAKSQDVAAIRDAKATLETESVKYGYYILQFMNVEAADTKYQWTSTMEAGKYPASAQNDLATLKQNTAALARELCSGALANPTVVGTPADAVSKVAEGYAGFEAFWALRYPDTYETLPSMRVLTGSMVNLADQPDTDGNTEDDGEGHKNQRVKTQLYLGENVDGVRLTVLRNIPGNSSNNGFFGDYPMVALGELKVYDATGAEVLLSESNFVASATEVNEGFDSGVARLCDGDWSGAGSYYHSPWMGNALSEHIWIDVTFPSAMSVFTVELISRDLSTNGGTLSLFPDSVVITPVGVEYDPMYYTENVYNATRGARVTSLDQLTDGLYVIEGLLNTHPIFGQDEYGDVQGVQHVYTDTQWFHKEVVRAEAAFRIKKNGETYTIQSLATGKYWPSSTKSGYASSTLDENKAAQLEIVPLAGDDNMTNTFALYEYHDGITKEILYDNGEGDSAYVEVATPYVVYMDWAGGLATRAVQNFAPGVGKDFAGKNVVVTDAEEDVAGDSLHFNKKNGEGQWRIYKLTMDTPDFYMLQGLADSYAAYEYRVGAHPGFVSADDSTAVANAIETALEVVEDETLEGDAKNTAAADAMKGIKDAVAGVEQAEMKEGSYILISALGAYVEKQNEEKAMYMDEDGLNWKGSDDVVAADEFIWNFTKVAATDEAVADLSDAEKAAAYKLQNKKTGKYVGYGLNEAGDVVRSVVVKSVPADSAAIYVVKNVEGKSAFNISPVGLTDASLHTNGHSSGAGVGGADNHKIVYWDNDADASQWYIVGTDYVISTEIEDLFAEGDEVVSVTYYTVGGAATSAPVKGINIVKVVYANGVIETKKLWIKD